MEILFSGGEYEKVETVDSTFISQTATNEIAVFLFKDLNDNDTDSFTVTWTGQSSYPTTSIPIKLEIYNTFTSSWEEIDSDNGTAANESITLTYNMIDDVYKYYDGSYWVTCRVSQGI